MTGLLATALGHDQGMAAPLLGVGGSVAGLYGLAGGDVHQVLPTLKRLFGGSQPATTSAPSQQPALSKYLNADGSLRFQDIVKAPDEELRHAAGLLAPDDRQKFHTQLHAFQPSLGQRLGAKALGIDVEGQRQRLLGLLGGEQGVKTADAETTDGLNRAALTAGGVGLGASAASSLLAGPLQDKLRQLDAFDPTVLNRSQAFSRGLSARDPGKLLANYVEHGHELASQPIFHGGQTGRDVMETLYRQPWFQRVTGWLGNKGNWDAAKSRHYQAFAHSPLEAYLQLSREMGHLPQVARYLDPSKRFQPAYDSLDAQVRGRAARGGLTAAEGWADPSVRAVVQPSLDAIDRHREIGVTRGVRKQIYDAALQNPRLARVLTVSGVRGPAELHKLPKAQQTDLLAHFNQTSLLGRDLSSAFAEHWHGPVKQYQALGNLISGSKRTLDAAQTGLNRVRRATPVLAAGSGLLAAGGLLAPLLMRRDPSSLNPLAG